MPAQTRARETRQRIIDSAVDLFYTKGYAAVVLSDITTAANITSGAFYYHFDSKEAVGAEIIRTAWPLWWDKLESCSGRPPALENLIALSFDLSDLLTRNRMALVAQHLNIAFYQRHDEVQGFEEEGTRSSFAMLSDLISEDDIRDDVTRMDVAVQVSMNIFGSHVLAGRMGDSTLGRLTRSWMLLLRGIARADTLPRFEQFVIDTAARYERGPTAELGPTTSGERACP